MNIKHLELKNYRNHSDLKIDFDQKITLITGLNGSGKTNIIEALHFLSTGKPFRARYDRDVIHHTKNFATIKGLVKKREQEKPKKIGIGILIKKSPKYENSSSKKVKIDGKSVRISDLSKITNTVLFSPLDMDLLISSPSNRRNFLDNILEQSDSNYKKTTRDYKKARRQKNKILEIIQETGKALSQLEYWNKKVLNRGVEIQEKRKNLIEYFNKNLNLKLKQSDPKLDCFVEYDINKMSKERLQEYEQKEIAARTSLIGPHRDDFLLTAKDRSNKKKIDLGNFSSRGQQRTLILALKLCELDYLENSKGERPILLLDDIFSELDEEHKKTLKSLVLQQQTIITATEIPEDFTSFPEIKLS